MVTSAAILEEIKCSSVFFLKCKKNIFCRSRSVFRAVTQKKKSKTRPVALVAETET